MKNGKLNMESETETILMTHALLTRGIRKTSLNTLKLGQALNKAKTKVKKNKGRWGEYVRSELSNIAPWEVRDFMYLASEYKKEQLSGLLWLNQTNLKKLFQLYNGESLKEILGQHGIELPTKEAADEEIRTFQGQIIELIKRRKLKKVNKLINTAKQKHSEKSAEDESPRRALRHYCKMFCRTIDEELRTRDEEVEYLSQREMAQFLEALRALKEFIKYRTRPVGN